MGVRDACVSVLLAVCGLPAAPADLAEPGCCILCVRPVWSVWRDYRVADGDVAACAACAAQHRALDCGWCDSGRASPGGHVCRAPVVDAVVCRACGCPGRCFGCAGRERVQREAVVHGSAEHARRDCGRRADGWDGSLDSDCHPGPVCVPVGGCGCDGPRVYHVADADCDFVCVRVCACDSCDWGVCCCWRVDVCRRVCPCRALCFVYDVRLFRFRVLTYAFHTYGQLIVSMTAITAALVSAGNFVALDLAGLLGEDHRPISPLSKEALNDRRIRIARFAMVFYAIAGVVGMALKEAWWVKLSDTSLSQTMALGLGVPIVFMELISGVCPPRVCRGCAGDPPRV